MSHIEPATPSRGLINSRFIYMFTSDVVIWLNGEQMVLSWLVTMVAVGQSQVPCMHVQFHYCSKGFEEGLSWFKMTYSVWAVFRTVSERGFSWNSDFISKFPCRVYREFDQMEDIHIHGAVGFIYVCRISNCSVCLWL